MTLMNKMMDYMMGRMDKAEKEEMMDRMMDKVLADMTVEDKKKMMGEMMPKMMEGINMMEMMPQMMLGMMGGKNEGGMMGMMPDMKGDPKEMQMPMMPAMMIEMMPRCLEMMLPNFPKEKRIDFILKMMITLIEHGLSDLTDTEKTEFFEEISALMKQ